MRGGDWDKSTCLEGLLEQKVGLVGYGMITRHLVKMLKPFHCNVLVYSSHVSDEELLENSITRASLDEIFSTCKVVSLHSALTPKTHHIINRKLLEMLDSEAILINTARGAIVDEEALGELLAQNRFRAVLDVFGQEPLPPNSPLRSLPNAYLFLIGRTYSDPGKCVTLRLVTQETFLREGAKAGNNSTICGIHDATNTGCENLMFKIGILGSDNSHALMFAKAL
jgi:lactate dehydrogenase-like 2-hydroxyacid dehydrogenase